MSNHIPRQDIHIKKLDNLHKFNAPGNTLEF